MSLPSFRLCLLLTRGLCLDRDPILVLESALRGGVDAVQIREKDLDSGELHRWGSQVARVCERFGVPLLVNDRVEVAAALGCAGVHLGQQDLHPKDAREILHPEQWIGVSTHGFEEVEQAAVDGADYLGFGPIFPSPTKDSGPCQGPTSLLFALATTRLPILAIGGINPENVHAIPQRAGVAVSSAICAAPDPEAAAQALRGNRDRTGG